MPREQWWQTAHLVVIPAVRNAHIHKYVRQAHYTDNAVMHGSSSVLTTVFGHDRVLVLMQRLPRCVQ